MMILQPLVFFLGVFIVFGIARIYYDWKFKRDIEEDKRLFYEDSLRKGDITQEEFESIMDKKK